AAPLSTELVRTILPPKKPLPAEADSAKVTRFSFIAYGDNRGRRDGKAEQYEHSLVVDSVLTTINRLANSQHPVKFIVTTGDAVVNGRDPKMWNVSFVDLVNRITQGPGVAFFPAPGNHEMGQLPGQPIMDPTDRGPGL